jgi:RIO-like serine/threonine protein kinase
VVLSPVGEHLSLNVHGVGAIFSAMADILHALVQAMDHGCLHRDVSYGNIICDPAAPGTGYLIDWQMSTLANSPLLFALTGTPLFMARVVSSIFFVVCLVQI